MAEKNKIKFTVNGIKCSVGCEISSDVMLLDYLRKYLELRGTKYMCREGGCGACIVSVVKSPGDTPVAVNSCLVSITSCFNWEITTVEKVGNRKDGYHAIQTNLAKENGTQCGHCSPGWVMAMYSILQGKKKPTMLEIENSFGSNICRCTGYRPIMEAFKKFGSDAPNPITISDIEDLKICDKAESCCKKKSCDENDWCFITQDATDVSNIFEIDLKDDRFWYRVSTVSDIFEVLNSKPNKSYMFVAGNTAKGAFPMDSAPTVLIDITGIPELKGWDLDQNLVINSGTTLTELINIFEENSTVTYFEYLKTLKEHIQLVAHIPVRNIGTVAGNLMIKHQHNEFTSDIFLLFETVGAQLTIRNNQNQDQTVTMSEFLKLDMDQKVIMKVMLPPLSTDHKIVTYKIMPRAQSVHATVNAGFLYKLQPNNIVESCSIVYSGLSPPFTRATKTENYLKGKELFTNETLQAAVKILNEEIVAVENPPEASPEYRKKLALGLFYKGLLYLCPTEKVNTRYRSGATKIHETRPVSKGQQNYDTNPQLYPLNQPLEKVEALKQCSGELMYTEDLPAFPFEVFGAFVLSTVCSGNIDKIDPSEALALKGVVAFYEAKDIPGLNSFTRIDLPIFSADEEVLCSGVVKHYNQPLGIIVAESQHLAQEAAKLVHVTYSNVKKPVIDIKEAKNDPSRVKQFIYLPGVIKGIDIAKVFKGSNTIYTQYHFPMETYVCVARPFEDGLEVYNSTQTIDGTQRMISKALNMDTNSIDVHCKRVGGSFGSKISRALQGAVACALVAKKLNRPCRFILPLTTNLRAVGKRFPCTTDYEVAVNRSGVIQYANYNLYEDNGYMMNETLYLVDIEAYGNLYKKTRISFRGNNVFTDTPKNTWCRAPGTLECIAMAEMMIEQICYEVSADPVDVRLANLDLILHSDMKTMVETLKTDAEYEKRKTEVNNFNKANRWKKRGLRVAMMSYQNVPAGQRLDVNLAVNHTDGTVVITHSGIELGQGINTKAIQIAAHLLKIPVTMIKVKGNDSISGPNAEATGGSITSQNVGYGVKKCCEELLLRLAPVKLLKPLADWKEIIETAYNLQIDLQAHGFVTLLNGHIFNNYGCCFVEAEVDILTGEREILRIDLLQDAGLSVNPALDVGQIEGAFIMGMGYFTMEEMVYNPDTAEVLTDRAWSYHVPQCRDIPQDFRVYLRKNSYSDILIFGAKATAEPPICLSVAVPFALREAVTSARSDSGIPTTQYFTIVGCEISSDVTLVDYLRNYLGLYGTKYMCREGGCGACIVTAVRPGKKPASVNACLVPITSCHNWDITTIEKVGNRKDGYHPIQKALVEEHGTQCGYCTPGWVMAMYSILQSKKQVTQLEIEKSFGSNLCRCTGYRSILDAFKKFAVDSPKKIDIPDIEDLKLCKNTGDKCKTENCDDSQWCYISKDGFSNIIEIDLRDNKTWYSVSTVQDIFEILRRIGNNSYMLACGNTAKGAYPIDEYPSNIIDISRVTELQGSSMDQNLVIKANTTFTEVMEIFKITSKMDNFHYLKAFYDHFQLVAHVPVRNLATLAGNLMTKHKYHEFTSDVFLLAETVDAQLTIQHYSGIKKNVCMQQFLRTDMRGKVILEILFPPLLDDEYKLITHKIMPRSQNAHAVVNAGFLYRLKPDGRVLQSRIVYSGLIPPSTRAEVTELFLRGKKLFTNETVQGAVKILEYELKATPNLPEPRTEYRKGLAVALFYKVQCSGEAEYTDDIPTMPHEVFATFVLTTEGTGNIVHIDASKALSQPGVHAFYKASDIPGLNSFCPDDQPLYVANEEVFCNGVVKYFNQPLGIVVADTQTLAERAAKMVKVTYKNVRRPITDIKEARKDKSRVSQYNKTDATDKGNNVALIVKGELVIYQQYHLPMETLMCLVKPTEQGLEVYMPTQWMDATQVMISRAMKMDINSIDVYVKRLGGAYGIKITRGIQLAVACSLVAKNLNRPCRMINPLSTNMKAVGKRTPALGEFEAAIDKSGVIQYVNEKFYSDSGHKVTETLAFLGLDTYQNVYKKSKWSYTGFTVLTDTAKNTWCRAPATLETIATAEFIMDRIAYEASLDPVELRLANLDTDNYSELVEMFETLKSKSDFDKRRRDVLKFNAENRWKKRGLRTAFMQWNATGPFRYTANLSVYHADGTVVITHPGIEMGQGINTKAIQIAAHFLKIPVEKIKVKGQNSISGANSFLSGSSLTSQNVGVAVQRCCEQLLERLAPIRAKMPSATWKEIIKNAYESDIDLQTHGYIKASETVQYFVCGACFVEVEVDILTGEINIIRVDLIEDPGRSINPEIDIGQIEGAFIMGLGYWTSEQIVFDPKNGEVLTNRTWNYYVPQARDIPEDFRVYLTNKYPSSDFILGTKATGEPGTCLAVAVPLAIREAIVSARLESGLPPNKWFDIDGPYTLDKIFLAASTNTDDYKLY